MMLATLLPQTPVAPPQAPPALYTEDFTSAGFAWVEHDDAERSVLSFLRNDPHGGAPVLVVCNMTPVPRPAYRVGVPRAGRWREVLNSDAAAYGGSGLGNLGGVETQTIPAHGHAQSLSLTVPPLAAIFLTP